MGQVPTQHPQEILLYRRSKSSAPPLPHIYRTHHVATALPTCLIHPAPRGHVSQGVMFSLKSAFLKGALVCVAQDGMHHAACACCACALMRSVAGAPLRARCLFTFSSWLPPRRSCLLFFLVHMGPLKLSPRVLAGRDETGEKCENDLCLFSTGRCRIALSALPCTDGLVLTSS